MRRRLICLAALSVAVGGLSLTAAGSASVDATATLRVTVSGAGGVTSVPRGIACPKACAKAFTKGKAVKLRAKAKPSAVFKRWTGACAAVKTAKCTVRMAAAKRVGAVFVPKLPANGWIAFTVEQSGDDLDIWFAALDQKARRVIGSDTDRVRQLCPAFSQDGRSLAYGRVERRGAEYLNAALKVADVSADGRVSGRLTIDVGDGLPPPCPVWSPAGDRLAFGVPRTSPINPDRSGVGSEVWVVQLADGTVTVLPDLLATDLDWSPDGSLLAVVGGVKTASGVGVTDGLQDARIHLFAPSSGTIRSLPRTLGVSSLTWSPDGGRIAYAGSGPGLRVIDVDTGRQRVLTPERSAPFTASEPVWSPDGETIVYQRRPNRGERYVAVLVTPGDLGDDGATPREVVIPAPQVTVRGYDYYLYPYRVTWSPDGQYLLYVAWGVSDTTVIVAVPTDPDRRPVVLALTENIVAYDGYDDTTFVPIQVWGRRPSD